MALKRPFVFLSALLGAVACCRAQGWLTPAYTSSAKYTLTPGSTLALPNGAGWTIFNAGSSASELAADYEVAAEGDSVYTPGTLLFSAPGALLEDEQAYLALGIRDASGTSGIVMRPADPSAQRLRTDKVYATVRFIPSDATPDVETLKAMYPTYADSLPLGGLEPVPTAAKLGVCVKQDGYFYVSRVRGAGGLDASGLPQDFVFEFCQTKVRYAKVSADDPNPDPTVGNGDVTLCIEFRSFQLPPDEEGGMAKPVTRAFRIFAKPASASDAAYVCLTAGRGYDWTMEEESDYAFDWSSFERDDACQWLYAFDSAVLAQSEGNYAGDPDAISELAFSATDGGFLAAWLALDGSSSGDEEGGEYDGYDTGAFAPYLADAAGHEAFAAWAAAYGVDLTAYLDSAEATAAAFDAFLLYMDPAAATGETRLTITGIVPEAETVTLTVRGPAGSDLSAAVAKGISSVRLQRAASLEGLPSATAQDCAAVPDGAGGLTLALPRLVGGQEQPFMRLSLGAAIQAE